jgi:hypothetical protein
LLQEKYIFGGFTLDVGSEVSHNGDHLAIGLKASADARSL